MLRLITACGLAAGGAGAANAAILTADPANLLSVFAAANNGDTIKASGTFGAFALQNRNWTTRVTLDASDAVFTDTLFIQNVTGLNVLHGIYGSTTAPMRSRSAVGINTSSNIAFLGGTFIGDGATTGADASYGMLITRSDFVEVGDSQFSNFRLGLGVIASRNIKIDNSSFVAMTSDGINIADSHRVTMTGNRCSGTVPYAGAHPDCIQLWSIRGNPVQSDIAMIRNTATGATQGFTSFNPADGGGLRISMIGNTVSTSYPQGVACYACVDSVFTDNIMSTIPGSLYQTTMNIIGGGNNVIANNRISPHDPAVAPVPEPGIWAQLILGFGIAGAVARRRASAIA